MVVPRHTSQRIHNTRSKAKEAKMSPAEVRQAMLATASMSALRQLADSEERPRLPRLTLKFDKWMCKPIIMEKFAMVDDGHMNDMATNINRSVRFVRCAEKAEAKQHPGLCREVYAYVDSLIARGLRPKQVAHPDETVASDTATMKTFYTIAAYLVRTGYFGEPPYACYRTGYNGRYNQFSSEKHVIDDTELPSYAEYARSHQWKWNTDMSWNELHSAVDDFE